MIEPTAFSSTPPLEAVSADSMLPARQPLPAQLVLVDLENLPAVSLRGLGKDVEVIVFVGAKQKKVPLDLAFLAQKHASKKFRFLQIPGIGPNALDFFIAYELGRRLERNPNTICTIISNDKGFDPLLKHLNANGMKCQRKGALNAPPRPASAAPTVTASNTPLTLSDKLLEDLKKRPAAARPSLRGSLKILISALCNKKISDKQFNAVIQHLVSKKLIALNGEQITYKF